MSTVFLITHPDVLIDPAAPVPDWPLNERGRCRMQALASRTWISGVRSIFSSSERKARDAAQILADGLGLAVYGVVDELGENDRTATGFLDKAEFEAAADAFFAMPQTSVRDWECAAAAQARIVGAVEQLLSANFDSDIAIIGHGGTGTLLYCHLAGLPISRRFDQPASNGDNWFSFDRVSCRKLLQAGWQSIDEAAPYLWEEHMIAKRRRAWRRVWNAVIWPLPIHIAFALAAGLACGIAASRCPDVIQSPGAAILGTLVLYPAMVVAWRLVNRSR